MTTVKQLIGGKGNGTKYAVSPTERWVMRLFMNQAEYGYTDPVEHPHAFFSQLEVRQAVQMAIDVDTILEEIFLGHGEPVWTEMFRPPYNVCDIPRPDFILGHCSTGCRCCHDR